MRRILTAVLLFTSLLGYGQPFQDQINLRVKTTTYNQGIQNLNDLIATRLTQSMASTLYKSISYVPSWSELTGKPSAFTPAAHSHSWADVLLDANHRWVTDLQIANWNSQAGAGFSGSYLDLSNRPAGVSAFPNDANYTTLSGSQINFDNRYVRLNGTYLNPDWLASIDWTKITQSASARFITDAERTTWNGKQNALGFTPYNATNPLGFQTAANVTAAIAGKQDALGFTPYNATNPAGYQTAANVSAAIAGKQNALTAGTNITISGNIISATNGSGTAPSTADIRAMFSGNSGISYDQPNGLFYLNNTAVVAIMENKMKSYDGWDAAVTKVLSTTGTTFKWVVATTGGSSSTVVQTAQSPRDTALFYADSTLSRFAVAGTTTVTLSTAAQIRSFLSSTQTNVDATVVNGTYSDGNEFAQTGNWTNVRFKAQTIGGVTLNNDAYPTAFILNNTHTVNKVCIQGFKFTTGYTGTSNNNPIVWNTELVTMDGLEWVDNEITTTTGGTVGNYNGFNMSQYSSGSASGAVAKNIWLHRNYIHNIPRANEILDQGYDKPRIIGFVATNNRIENMGLNNQYGFGFSLSGYIKGVLQKGNSFVNCKGITQELVNVQYALLIDNPISNTNTAVAAATGIGISDDGQNLTKYIYVENPNATVRTTGRSFYGYDSKNVYFTGGNYIGNYGVDMQRLTASSFKNLSVKVYDRVSAGGPGTSFVWQLDTGVTGVTLDNVNVSSSNTIANGGLYAREVLVLKGSNNIIQNSTFTQGKQADGTYYGFILANSGTGNTLTNNATVNGL